MDVCWEDKMILCTSSEICRDGTTPHGGVIDGDHWVPISDNYNDWIQVGKDNGTVALVSEARGISGICGRALQFNLLTAVVL